ncbi:MAG: amidohydrolase [Candidatus Tectimicrobiota bacterium]|nr:MAG: amidohydrolase [Candidatus Tectomicrobia bacterium]
MAKQGFKVLDSDMHVIEPPDLWVRYGDPAFRHRMPRGLTEFRGDLRMVGPDGTPWGRTEALATAPRRTGRNFEKNQVRWKPYEEQGWSGQAQLQAMDVEGIDVAVLYPSRGLFALTVPDLEPPLAAAIARAYNDWLADFVQADPTRLLGAAMISPFAVEDAIAEARRAVTALGFKAVFLRPNIVCHRNWHDPYYDPLWATLAELGVPLGFHEGAGARLPQAGARLGANRMLHHVICHPVEQMMAVTSFCGGGILERHPTLRVAFLEGNCSWVPFLLWRLDEHVEWLGDVYAQELTLRPSEYFKRQCFVSVEADEAPARHVIEEGLGGRLVFSTDFPHGDSKFPEAVEHFLTLPLTDADKRRILWDNCAAYYGLSN